MIALFDIAKFGPFLIQKSNNIAIKMAESAPMCLIKYFLARFCVLEKSIERLFCRLFRWPKSLLSLEQEKDKSF